MSALVKIHCPTLPDTAKHYWSDLAFAYCNAVIQSRLPTRIVSTTLGNFQDDSNWFDLADWFQTEFDERTVVVNMVIGDPRTCSKFHSQFIPFNVAVTAIGPAPAQWTDEACTWFKKYNAVWLPSWTVAQKIHQKLVTDCSTHVIHYNAVESIDKKLREWIQDYL